MDEETPDRLSTKPSWLIGQLANQMRGLVSEGFAAADARGYHYRLLAALGESGPSSQADLGRQCRVDRSDVVLAVNELADAGFVRRTPDPGDRRRNVITITAAGKRRLGRLDRMLDGVQDELLAPLSATERAALTGFLRRLVDHHDARSG